MARDAYKNLSLKVKEDDPAWAKIMARPEYCILPAPHLLTAEGARTAKRIVEARPQGGGKILVWTTVTAANPNSRASGYELARRKTLLECVSKTPGDAVPADWPGFARTPDKAPAIAWPGPDGIIGTKDDAWVVDPHDVGKTFKHATIFQQFARKFAVPYDGIILDYLSDPRWGHYAFGPAGPETDLDGDGLPVSKDPSWQSEKAVWHTWNVQTVRAFVAIHEGKEIWCNGLFWDRNEFVDWVHAEGVAGVYYERIGRFGWQSRDLAKLEEAVKWRRQQGSGVILDSTESTYKQADLISIANAHNAVFQYPAGKLP